MASQLHPARVPSATDTARARGIDIAEFVARTYGYQGSSDLDLWQRSIANLDDFWNAVWTYFGVQGQLRAEAQVLNPLAKSPSTIGATITSSRGRS
jgi:hypothetical protein